LKNFPKLTDRTEHKETNLLDSEFTGLAL